MRSVKAAAVQLSPVLYSREGTVDKIVRKIHELGREGVQFATFCHQCHQRSLQTGESCRVRRHQRT